jgi:3-hydroxy acid dehydrogenase/malonic semialdehyde reductase
MTAVVTGASSGIGAAIATALLEAGMQVICVGRERARLDLLAARFGRAVIAAPCDLADSAALDGLAAMLADHPVEVLVNNAGHDAGGGVPFDRVREGDAADAVAVNLVAAMRLTHALLPRFLAADRGHVVMTGSIVTHRPAAGLAAYAASKAGLHGFVAGLRMDYATTGLRFTEVIPGVVRTGFAARRLHGDEGQAAAFYDRFAATLSPADVARAVLFAIQQPAACCVEEIVLMPTRRRP